MTKIIYNVAIVFRKGLTQTVKVVSFEGDKDLSKEYLKDRAVLEAGDFFKDYTTEIWDYNSVTVNVGGC